MKIYVSNSAAATKTQVTKLPKLREVTVPEEYPLLWAKESAVKVVTALNGDELDSILHGG